MPELEPHYQIQPASLFDLTALRRLEKLCFPLDAWPLLDMIAALSMPNIVRYKAVARAEMVGFIAGEVRFPSRIGWIATLCVHPDHRRRGIAQELLALVEQKMEQPRIRLTVRQSNLAAIKLYRANGYLEVDSWPGYYNGGEDGVVMEKVR